MGSNLQPQKVTTIEAMECEMTLRKSLRQTMQIEAMLQLRTKMMETSCQKMQVKKERAAKKMHHFA